MDISEMKEPGKYGVRGAQSESDAERETLKRSILEQPTVVARDFR